MSNPFPAPESSPGDIQEFDLSAAETGEGPVPRHGFQGDRKSSAPARRAPLGLSIAISREAGARGGTIARLVGQHLGWQVYDQELLEFMAQDSVARASLTEELPPACLDWMQERLDVLRQQSGVGQDPAVENLARVVLSLAAQGEVVILGRGASSMLPRETTLNARILAPLPDRIAYMSQWLRLSAAEAREKVRLRDDRRAQFLQTQFGSTPADVHLYDLLLNSSTLGEDACVQLIVLAARLRGGVVGASRP